MRILLLNPPANAMVQRDHYCSATSKTDHYWPPIDLLLQSGLLAIEHEVQVLDAIVERLTWEESIGRVREFAPDAIVALSSIISIDEDIRFLTLAKNQVACRVILMGDIHYFRPDLLIEHETIDAVCLQYPARGLNAYLAGESDPPDIVHKRDGRIHVGARAKGEVSYGVPRHELFPIERYRFPLTMRMPFAMVLTGLSCPMNCAYCPVSSLPFREREWHEIFAELDELRNKRVPELVFADLMFNAKPERLRALCEELARRDYDFTWSCLLRPDLADRELLAAMKRAGCHTIMFGVDTTSADLLKANKRRMDLEAVRETFEVCRELDIRSFAFLILGLPGETMATARESIDFVCSLPADYLSVNLFAPRPGSAYLPQYRHFSELIVPTHEFARQAAEAADFSMDSTRTKRSHCELTPEQLRRLRRQALLRFYLRPSLLVRHLGKLESWHHLQQLVARGSRLLLGL